MKTEIITLLGWSVTDAMLAVKVLQPDDKEAQTSPPCVSSARVGARSKACGRGTSWNQIARKLATSTAELAAAGLSIEHSRGYDPCIPCSLQCGNFPPMFALAAPLTH